MRGRREGRMRGPGGRARIRGADARVDARTGRDLSRPYRRIETDKKSS